MKKLLALFLIILFFTVFFSSYFIVRETEQVVVTRFGKPIGEPIHTAGIHFKIPLIDTANFIEKRILEWDGDPRQITTKDKKFIMIDSTARWQIEDPLVYLQTTGNDIQTTFSRLDGIIDSNVRDSVSNHDLIEVARNSNQIIETLKAENLDNVSVEDEPVSEKISVGREQITREILQKASPTLKKYGIKLVDLRIKGLMYNDSVQQKVFERMISERNKMTEKIRSEGMAEKSRIEGKRNLDLKTLESEAYKKTQEIKGEADAQATAIFAQAYNQDPDLYSFLTSLDSNEFAIHNNTSIVLGTDSEFFKVLTHERSSGQNSNAQ